jgi:zinc transporter ZupT
MVEPDLGMVIFIAIIAHKATASFSLSTIFQLADFPVKKTLSLILLFSVMTPLGALSAWPSPPGSQQALFYSLPQ